MTTAEDRVKAVVARVLHIELSRIKPQHNFGADLGAESVQSLELVAAFEEEFGIDLDEDAALSVNTVGAAVEFLSKACQEKGIKV